MISQVMLLHRAQNPILVTKQTFAFYSMPGNVFSPSGHAECLRVLSGTDFVVYAAKQSKIFKYGQTASISYYRITMKQI